METIFHIIPRAAWSMAQPAGEYRADSLAIEGFIHCSRRSQLVQVANALFAGQADLLLLEIAVARLTAPVKLEDTAGVGEAFPHLYGPLNLDAVVAVHEFAPGADGKFRLPP